MCYLLSCIETLDQQTLVPGVVGAASLASALEPANVNVPCQVVRLVSCVQLYTVSVSLTVTPEVAPMQCSSIYLSSSM